MLRQYTLQTIFPSISNVANPYVSCDYRGDLNGYGYGTNCPLNYGYGDIYNVSMPTSHPLHLNLALLLPLGIH